MANNSDEHEGYIEIPMSDYIIIGQTAIHKNWTIGWGLTSFISGIVLFAVAIYTNWYSILASRVLNASARYWYITVPILFFLVIIVYLQLRSARNKKRPTQK